MTHVERRDCPGNEADRIDRKQLTRSRAEPSPSKEYFAADQARRNCPRSTSRLHRSRAGLDRQLQWQDVSAWRSFLRWHVIPDAAPMLSRAFVDEDFRFSGTVLTGAQQLSREERCMAATGRSLRDTLGEPWSRRHSARKPSSDEGMVQGLLGGPWGGPGRDQLDEAQTKRSRRRSSRPSMRSSAISDELVDFSFIVVERGVLARGHGARPATPVAPGSFENQRTRRTGRIADDGPTVNANKRPSATKSRPAGDSCSPPFFDDHARRRTEATAGSAPSSGTRICSRFNNQDRPVSTTTPKTTEGLIVEHQAPRSSSAADSCRSNGSSSTTYSINDLHVQRKLTLPENIRDLGFLKIAHAAFVEARRKLARGRRETGSGGRVYPGRQPFFLDSARVWCSIQASGGARLRVQTDPRTQERLPCGRFPLLEHPDQAEGLRSSAAPRR